MLQKALDNIGHRGPDHRAVYSDPYYSVGHCRLSIIDITEKGNQPFTDQSGNYVLAYNGVCYNHRELRAELARSGVTFRSESDTETVLYWLISRGSDGLAGINGFFSLALYDKLNKKLLLARDRFGIKPLYYHSDEKAVSFSSELRGLLPLAGKQKINNTSLCAYLHLNYIPSPYTIFEGVHKVLPGTFLSVNVTGHLEMHRYFSTEYGARQRQGGNGESIFNCLENSVKRRLLSDVPLGCFLSGGLDSSIITGLASRQVEKLNTFTVVFRNHSRLDESRDAAAVAKHFGTNHHEIELGDEDIAQSLEKMLSSVDEPFADSSAIAMFNLCRKAKSAITVALSGDGGDELFAGYNKHLALYYSFRFPAAGKAGAVIRPFISGLPLSRNSGISNFFRKMEKYGRAARQSPAERYWHWAGYGNTSNDLAHCNISPADFMSKIGPGRIQTFEDCLKMDLAMVLEGDMLAKTDRMSMFNGLEVRVPFLDHELVEVVTRIPVNQKISFNHQKKLLRGSFSGMLPKAILNKKKHGFEVPLGRWLKTMLPAGKNDVLSAHFIAEQSIFNPVAVERLISQFNASAGGSEYTYWNLLVFNSWWASNREYISG